MLPRDGVHVRIAADRLQKGEVTFRLKAYSWWDKHSSTLETKYRI